MKKITIMIVVLVTFSGCTGLVTGHDYKMSDAKVLYSVTKVGVTTFMTQEEIEAYNLDTLNDATVKIYELSEGNVTNTVVTQ